MDYGEKSQLPCSVGLGPQRFEIKEETCASDWKTWLRGFEIFADASGMSIDKKKSWLLHYAGHKVQSIYYNLPCRSNDTKRSAKTQYRKIVEALTEYFAPKQNTSYERHVFRSMSQHKDERIDAFVMRLRTQADRCEFGRRVEENIKDQVTSSCWSGSLRRKILERNHKNLESVMKLCRIFESVANQEKTFMGGSKSKVDGCSGNEATEVCNINDRKNFRTRYFDKNKAEGRNQVCDRCAREGHKANDEICPAKGKICGRCGKTGHFARKCYTNISNNDSSSSIKRESVRMVEEYDDYDDTF